MGRIIPYILENKKCLKPPTRYCSWSPAKKLTRRGRGQCFLDGQWMEETVVNYQWTRKIVISTIKPSNVHNVQVKKLKKHVPHPYDSRWFHSIPHYYTLLPIIQRTISILQHAKPHSSARLYWSPDRGQILCWPCSCNTRYLARPVVEVSGWVQGSRGRMMIIYGILIDLKWKYLKMDGLEWEIRLKCI